MNIEVKTRMGCRVLVESVGDAVGVTITQAAGCVQTFACGKDEAWKVARALMSVSLPPEAAAAPEVPF